MGMATIVQGAFAAIKTLVPNSVVACIIGGVSANGVRDTGTSATNLNNDGERGTIDGTVRLSLADITEPAQGDTILVAGVACVVTQTRVDPVAAICAITFTEQKPITA